MADEGSGRTAQAYRHIKAHLVDGAARPGERLSVVAFGETLGMSRQPIMAAMRMLATEGLVEIVPQVGCRVILPGRAEVRDFYRYLAQCEGLMAELAAERASGAERAALGELLGRLDATTAGDGEAYVRLNRAFHQAIHEMAHSPALERQIAQIFDRRDFYNSALDVGSPPERLGAAQRFHHEIVAALAARDGARARRAMEAHVLESPLFTAAG